MNRLNREMIGLRPGDVLTNLECSGCRGHKILILGRVDEGLDFSMRTSKLNIARDPRGPWRWNMGDMVFKNAAGEVYDHIGSDVKVQEGAGLRELGWYRKLPQPADIRFNIDAKAPIADLHEPALLAKWDALLNRGTDNQSLAVSMQLAIDLIFGDHATEVVDERRMRLLMAFTHTVAQQLGSNTLKRTKEATDALMGRGRVGIKIMGLGPNGVEHLGNFFDGDVADLPDDMPDELREVIAAITGRGRQQRGNGRDESPSFGSRHYGG